MNDFKWKHYRGEIILGCVHWYCKYGISYRDLKEMMIERGVEVDHTTLYRWVQQFAPEIEKRLRWYYKSGMGESWKVDETYVKVKGKWKYLYRAITKSGKTLDFYLSSTRNAKAAKRFLSKALRKMKEYENQLLLIQILCGAIPVSASNVNYVRNALLREIRGFNFIYHGFAGDLLFQGVKKVLRVRIIASREFRIRAAMHDHDITHKKAATLVDSLDKKRDKWSLVVLGKNWADHHCMMWHSTWTPSALKVRSI